MNIASNQYPQCFGFDFLAAAAYIDCKTKTGTESWLDSPPVSLVAFHPRPHRRVATRLADADIFVGEKSPASQTGWRGFTLYEEHRNALVIIR